ncbi:MAG: hypothetical protein V3U58_01590 [Thermodesulfobacteriota bacterium]
MKEIELPGRGGGDTRASSNDGRRLTDMGLTYQDSHRAQRLAEYKDVVSPALPVFGTGIMWPD